MHGSRQLGFPRAVLPAISSQLSRHGLPRQGFDVAMEAAGGFTGGCGGGRCEEGGGGCFTSLTLEWEKAKIEKNSSEVVGFQPLNHDKQNVKRWETTMFRSLGAGGKRDAGGGEGSPSKPLLRP